MRDLRSNAEQAKAKSGFAEIVCDDLRHLLWGAAVSHLWDLCRLSLLNYQAPDLSSSSILSLSSCLLDFFSFVLSSIAGIAQLVRAADL